MNKKRLWALGLSLVAATALASTYAIIKPQPLSPNSSDSSTVTQANSVKVAIVNEDIGTNYNGQDLKISETLINSYQSQLNYPMEVVSRATAEKGLESGLYQLMVIFPSKFSEDSLALESVSPTKALFQYKIKADKTLEVKQAEQAVLDIKGLFNKDLINIYFLSIIGNLQTAQTQVSDVVTNEESTLNTYRDFLANPLSEYSQKFEGINAIPESLRDSYDNFNNQLGSSNESFSAVVDTERNYDSELEEIRQRQETWQLALSEREQLLSEYNNNLSDLTISEALEQLTIVKDDLVNYINLPELWDDTVSRSQVFNQNIEELASILEQMNLSVDTTLSSYDSTIRDAVNDSLSNSNGSLVNDGSLEKTLGYYVDDINSRITSQLDQYLETFIQYDDETIDTFNLSPADKQYLKNINTFIAWYQSVNNKAGRELTNRTAQSNYLTDIQEYVVEQLRETSLLTITNVRGEVKDIELTVNEGYTVTELDRQIIPLEDGTSEVQVYYQVFPNDLTNLSVLEAIQVTATVNSDEIIDVGSNQLEESTIISEEMESPVDDAEGSVLDGELGEKESEVDNKDLQTPTTSVLPISHKNSESKVHFPFASYTGVTETQATHKDVMGYLELAGLIRAYYDINLKSAQISLDNMPIGRNAVISEGDTDNLRKIIVSLIKDTTVNNLKDNLKISDEKLSEFEQLKLNSEELTSNLEELKTNTSNLVSELDKVVTQANAINEVLANRPQLDMDDTSLSNTDLVEVSAKMGSDLTTLLLASQQLLDNSRETQGMSDSIKTSLETLSSTVTELQEEGVLLSSRVNELRNVMSEEYDSNEEFLKSFTTVLSNTKLGNANNEAVYEYLSDPIDASKIESVLEIATSNTTDTTRRDERSGFLIVIIAYLASLIISYLKQHSDLLSKRRLTFRRISWQNSIIPMNFLTGLSFLASLPIAIVASQRLSLSVPQTGLLGMMTVIVVLLFTYGINLLLEKGKSYGFLITIFLLLLYFIVATQLLEVYYITDSRYLAIFSPLTYVEGMLTNFINQDPGWRLPLGIMILLLLVFGTLNAVIYRIGDRRRER